MRAQRAGQPRRQRRGLLPEELKQFRLKLVIAKALAGQMNKVEGGIETASRVLKHSVLVRPPGSPRPKGAAGNR